MADATEDDSRPIEQFPDSECVRVTDNVFIHHPPYEGCGYRIWFGAGVQYFGYP